MKILITGIHGFVGSNLVNALKKEHTLYGLDIVAPQKDGVVKTYSWQDMEQGGLPAVDSGGTGGMYRHYQCLQLHGRH